MSNNNNSVDCRDLVKKVMIEWAERQAQEEARRKARRKEKIQEWINIVVSIILWWIIFIVGWCLVVAYSD